MTPLRFFAALCALLGALSVEASTAGVEWHHHKKHTKTQRHEDDEQSVNHPKHHLMHKKVHARKHHKHEHVRSLRHSAKKEGLLQKLKPLLHVAQDEDAPDVTQALRLENYASENDRYSTDQEDGEAEPDDEAPKKQMTLPQVKDEIKAAWKHQAYMEQLAKTVRAEKALQTQETALVDDSMDESALAAAKRQVQDTQDMISKAETNIETSRVAALQVGKDALAAARAIKAEAHSEFMAADEAAKKAEAEKKTAMAQRTLAVKTAANAQEELSYFTNALNFKSLSGVKDAFESTKHRMVPAATGRHPGMSTELPSTQDDDEIAEAAALKVDTETGKPSVLQAAGQAIKSMMSMVPSVASLQNPTTSGQAAK